MKAVIGTIVFPIFCLLLSLQVLVNDPAFTYLLLNKEAVGPTKQLFQYFQGKAEVPQIFDEQEKSHLQDVKHLLKYSYYLLEIITVILAFCLIDEWKKIIKYGTILLLILLAIGFFIPFDSFFTSFHELLFPQGNWQFATDSTLIQLYPASFFENYGIAIGINALLAALVLLYLGYAIMTRGHSTAMSP